MFLFAKRFIQKMFFFEKYFSLYAFSIGWGFLVTIDFVLRLMGLAGYHGI